MHAARQGTFTGDREYVDFLPGLEKYRVYPDKSSRVTALTTEFSNVSPSSNSPAMRASASRR
jgi:hypothetical protein